MDTRSSAKPQWSARMVLEQIAGYGLPIGASILLSRFVPEGSYVRIWPIILGVLAGLPCALALWLPLRFVLRTPGNRSVFPLILAAYCLLGVGPQAFRVIDRGLDDSPRTPRTLRIIDRSRSSKGGSKITLEHWLPGEKPFAVNGWGEIGGQVEVYAHGGLLGFDWVELPADAALNERRGLLGGER